MQGKSATYPSGFSVVPEKVLQQQSTYFSLTYLIVLFAYPVSSYLSEMAGIQSNMLSIAARGIVLATSLFYLSFLLVKGLFKPVPEFYLFLLFWAMYAFRILYDTNMYDWQLGRKPSEYYLFAFGLSFMGAVPFFVPVKIPIEKLTQRIWAILFFLNILGIYNNLKAANLFAERLGGNERLNPILYGMLAGLLFIVALLLLLKKRHGVVMSVVLIGSALLGASNLFVAASKSPFILVGTSTVFMIVYFVKNKQAKNAITLLSVFFVAICLVIAFNVQDFLLLALSRFTEINDDVSSQERVEMLNNAIAQIKESPVIGSFLEEKVYKEYPHNLTVESFMATGIFGGFTFLTYYIGFFRQSIRTLFTSHLSIIAFVGFSAFIISMFSGGLSFSTDFWTNSAVLLALGSRFNPYKNNGHNKTAMTF